MSKFKTEDLEGFAALVSFQNQFKRMPVIARGQTGDDFDALVKKSLETKVIQPGLMLAPVDKSVRAS